VNRDVDVRLKFLGFCLRVHSLALLLDGPYGREKNTFVCLRYEVALLMKSSKVKKNGNAPSFQEL